MPAPRLPLRRIVNVGSTSGIVRRQCMAAYSPVKGRGTTRVLAKEVGLHGITLNAVAPFATRAKNPETELSTGSRWQPEPGLDAACIETRTKAGISTRDKAVVGEHLGRWFLPSEIGAAVVFLAG